VVAKSKTQSEAAADKYVKVNPYCYKEQRGDERPFDWFKHPEILFVRLYDIKHILSVSLDGEVEPLDDSHATIDGESWKLVRDNSKRILGTEGKEKKVRNGIQAEAVIEDGIINLFENGQIVGPRFDTVDFTCSEGDGVGFLAHNAGAILNYDRFHNKPYLSVETYLPPELFRPLLQQIEEENITEALVCLKCELFRSEVDRALSEPWMHQDYTIEAESYYNYVGIVWIRVGGKKYVPRPMDDEGLSQNKEATILIAEDRASPEQQIMVHLVNELRRTNKMLKAIAIAIGTIAILYLFFRK
jgi:hypothetical protein